MCLEQLEFFHLDYGKITIFRMDEIGYKGEIACTTTWIVCIVFYKPLEAGVDGVFAAVDKNEVIGTEDGVIVTREVQGVQ